MSKTIDEMLPEIQSGVDDLLRRQGVSEEQIEKWNKEAAETRKRIAESTERQEKAISEMTSGLSSFNERLAEVEKIARDARFTNNANGESDALYNVLPERIRKQIPMLKAHAGSRSGDQLRGWERRALDNPTEVAGIAYFFQLHIKKQLAHHQGNYDQAKNYTDELKKLIPALGGFPDGTETMVKAAGDPLGGAVDAFGGYLVPVVTEAMIGWLLKDGSSLRAAGATTLTMTTSQHELPNKANDFKIIIKDENAAPDFGWGVGDPGDKNSTPDTPFGQSLLTAKTWIALVTISAELVQDNIIGLLDFLVAHLINEMGLMEDMAFIDGTVTQYQAVSMSALNPVVTGATAAVVNNKTVPFLIYHPEHRSAVNTGVIWAHSWLARDLIALSTGGSGAVFTPFAFTGGMRTSNLYGVPFYGTAGIDRTAGAGSESNAYYGNPTYAVIGDRLGTTIDVNPWANPEYENFQVRLRIVRRTGYVTWVPEYFSQIPWITEAIT